MTLELTERENNLMHGVLETLKLNDATDEEIQKVCKKIMMEKQTSPDNI